MTLDQFLRLLFEPITAPYSVKNPLFAHPVLVPAVLPLPYDQIETLEKIQERLIQFPGLTVT